MINKFNGEHHFLSNFHPKRICYLGEIYNSVEYAYQAAKVVDNPSFMKRIQNASSPGETKRLAREAYRKGFVRKDWRDVNIKIMRKLLYLKFMSGYIRILFLDTGEEELIEGNWWHDNFWGDCSCGRQACKEPGLNVLGKTLMELRDQLRHEETTMPISKKEEKNG